MSIESHLLEDEEIKKSCSTNSWDWFCTNERIIKYSLGTGKREELHDLSYREVSSISLTNPGRKAYWAIIGLLLVTFGLGLLFLAASQNIRFLTDPEVWGPSLLSIASSIYCFYKWLNSDRSYFKFNGSGMLQENNGVWRIDRAGMEDKEQVRDFVRTVRSQLN